MNHKQFFLFLFLISYTGITHSCGFALVRLFKPLTYYRDTYNDVARGIHKLCLLMEKQRNRGQDSVGLSVMQFDMPPGQSFMKRCRSAHKNALEQLFAHINQKISTAELEMPYSADDLTIKQYSRYLGEIYLGHLRYATHGGNKVKFSQPYLYKNSIPSKCLLLAGNFNMTNSLEIMNDIVSQGLAPSNKADTHLITHQISHCLDKAYENELAALEHILSPADAAHIASDNLNISSAIRQATKNWDGGYVFAGIIGNGDTFIFRDPSGIRPAYYYMDEELFAAASERAALMNAFSLPPDKIKEVPHGQLIVIKKNGDIEKHQFTPELPPKRCVFERIYFSRPSDPDIYQERKALGFNLAQRLFEELNFHTKHAVFSYIPNTSEISFNGLVEELNRLAIQYKHAQLVASKTRQLSEINIADIVNNKIRVEKLIFKDQVIRTFIANDAVRADLVSKVYDVTRGVITDQDTLIALDDSIVRGTTLRQSIMRRLITLNPKKIIITSAAPIILYPDCYGIDMSQIGNLIGFQAAIALTKERGNQHIIDEIYHECVTLQEQDTIGFYNPLKKLYDQFSQKELEEKIAELVYPSDSSWSGELRILYQTIEGMRQAIPGYAGDWYFTGKYPTKGGYKVLVNSFINWYTNKQERAY